MYSIDLLRKRFQRSKSSSSGTAHLSFDKDDDDMLDFVAASANLRSSIFGIGAKSKFEIKRKLMPQTIVN
jgi:ubiquitin-like 1-activating enzyme E1 B